MQELIQHIYKHLPFITIYYPADLDLKLSQKTHTRALA